MANKYKYNYTFDELREEEDREVINDYYREKTMYYRTMIDINAIIYTTLKKMTFEERKEVLTRTLVTPVARLR